MRDAMMKETKVKKIEVYPETPSSLSISHVQFSRRALHRSWRIIIPYINFTRLNSE